MTPQARHATSRCSTTPENDFTGTHYDPVWVNVQAEPAPSSAASSGDAMRVQGADDSQANADAVLPIRQTAWQSMMRVIRDPASAGTAPPRGMGGIQPVAGAAAVQPPPAPPSDQPRRRKRQKTMDGNEGSAAGKDEAGQQDGPTTIDFYALRCMSSEESPDPRCALEAAIDALAAQLREDPTLPADANNGGVPSCAALREDAAVQLPAKHCAFAGCTWQGSTDTWRSSRTCARPTPVHLNSGSRVVAEMSEPRGALPTLLMNGGHCATVVRRGAPLATYAIDRRCLWNYVNCLDDDGVEALICFLCARRFPYLAEWGTANDVRWVKPADTGR